MIVSEIKLAKAPMCPIHSSKSGLAHSTKVIIASGMKPAKMHLDLLSICQICLSQFGAISSVDLMIAAEMQPTKMMPTCSVLAAKLALAP